MISKTKIDDIFPKVQVQIKDFSDPFIVDRNCHGREISFYAREDIPVCFFMEINLRERKWLDCCLYNPYRDKLHNHLSASLFCSARVIFSVPINPIRIVSSMQIFFALALLQAFMCSFILQSLFIFIIHITRCSVQ